MTNLDAILPAGGSIDLEFAAEAGTAVKALIRMGDETMLQRAIDAVRGVTSIRRVVVIGGDEVRGAVVGQSGVVFLPEGKSGPENIYNGVQALIDTGDPPEKVLIVATDQPFLTSGVVQGFLDSCPPAKQICVPLIRESEFQARFPGTSATFARLRDDTWTTGGIFLLDVPALLAARSHVEKVFENRKSKLGMAKLLGPTFVFKWLSNRLTLADVERKIESLLGASGAAVTGSAPELAYDVDDLEDLRHAARFATEKEFAR